MSPHLSILDFDFPLSLRNEVAERAASGMAADITTFEFQANKAEEGWGIVRDSILPSMKKQQGLRELLFLRDSKTGNALVLTLWDSAASMEASAGWTFPLELPSLAYALSRPPRRHIYKAQLIRP